MKQKNLFMVAARLLLWPAALMLPVFGAKAAVVFTTLHFFNGTNDGAFPWAGLVQGSDGYFYGTTTEGGGTNNLGTVFKISTAEGYTSLYSFSGTNDGANPHAALVQGSDGYFYGTTENGGRHGDGTVFQISTNGALATLYSFSGTNDGANPYAALVQGSDGYFYGTTDGGGANNLGTVFKISTNGTLTSLYSFGSVYEDGAYPQAGLVQGSDGYFYGTTSFGGKTNYGGFGTVFKIITNGVLTTLYAFGTVTNANGRPLDGWYPAAGLVQDSDGYLYGTTEQGGTNDVSGGGGGTVFKISTGGALTSLYSFGGEGFGGAYPYGGLVQGSDGYFYGTTAFNYDGVNQIGHDYGTVFKINTNGALTSLYSFSFPFYGTNDGEFPRAGLVQGNDGNFYGTTGTGGLGYPGGGTIFRLTIVPEFQSVTLTNSMVRLTWSTEAGGTYQLQYTSDLTSDNWVNLNAAITATGPTLTTTDSVVSGRQRFYRLVLSP